MDIFPKALLHDYFKSGALTLGKLNLKEVLNAAEILQDAIARGQQIFICGNGGSAATASHFTNDLMKVAGARAICLNDMVPTMLAYMNDDGVGNMFLSPLKALVHRSIGEAPSDVFIGISCSGNSKNVVSAAGYAKEEIGADVIAFTGDVDGKLSDIADVSIRVSHSDIRIQEDAHLVVCHALVGILGADKKWV